MKPQGGRATRPRPCTADSARDEDVTGVEEGEDVEKQIRVKRMPRHLIAWICLASTGGSRPEGERKKRQPVQVACTIRLRRSSKHRHVSSTSRCRAEDSLLA